MATVTGRISRTMPEFWRCHFCDGRLEAGQRIEFISRLVVHNDLADCFPANGNQHWSDSD